jgi:NAD-dependent dihydropyrimidine dehydrogenase PreA subunit
MPYVIASACIDTMDQSCVEECPVSCIYVGARKLYIHPDECIDCGACEQVCPVQAISQDRSVPPEETPFIADNRRFFIEVLPGREAALGSPGGAGQSGDIGADTPLVASWG